MSEVIFIPLALLMYEMVTGRVPFEGDNTVAVALAHLEDAYYTSFPVKSNGKPRFRGDHFKMHPEKAG